MASETKFFIEVDRDKKIFRLSAPVFRGSSALVSKVAQFFASAGLQGASLTVQGKNVLFQQEVPFAGGMRLQVHRFLRRANQCRNLFRDVENIERFQFVEAILES
jgi:hypothetical protein